MGRDKGIFDFSASLEPQTESPLDSRLVVGLYSDLLKRETWDKGNGT